MAISDLIFFKAELFYYCHCEWNKANFFLPGE